MRLHLHVVETQEAKIGRCEVCTNVAIASSLLLPTRLPSIVPGGKCTAWEGGLRGTAFASGAGIAASASGRMEHSIMHTIDVLPTLFEALGGGTCEDDRSTLTATTVT